MRDVEEEGAIKVIPKWKASNITEVNAEPEPEEEELEVSDVPVAESKQTHSNHVFMFIIVAVYSCQLKNRHPRTRKQKRQRKASKHLPKARKLRARRRNSRPLHKENSLKALNKQWTLALKSKHQPRSRHLLKSSSRMRRRKQALKRVSRKNSDRRAAFSHALPVLSGSCTVTSLHT